MDPQYESSQKVSRIKDYPLIYQSESEISWFLKEISRVLEPGGFCFLWISKEILMTGKFLVWLRGSSELKVVDLLIWAKPHFGFGSYFRNQVEFGLLIQKYPTNSKRFKNRSLGNVWTESVIANSKRNHPHQKPKGLVKAIIEATTDENDLVVDPCAGSFMVLEACRELGREFMGCDLTYLAMEEFKSSRGRVCQKCLGLLSNY